MDYTGEQQDVIQAASRRGRSVRVKAFAGAGKTTTLRGVARERGETGLYLAFNRAIAQEAGPKFANTGVKARTMHGAVYAVMREHISETIPGRTRCVIDAGVLPGYMMSGLSKGWNRFRLAAAVSQSVAKWCASADSELDTEHVADAIKDMEGDPAWMPAGSARDRAERALRDLPGRLVPVARSFLAKCIGDGKFTHDMYLKCAEVRPDVAAEAFQGFRYLMVDEAQDLNPVQRSLLEKSGLPVISVGDSYQQIYSWRGSQNALDHLPGDELYLTGSFRFGDKVADLGRKILASRPDGGPVQRLEGLGPPSVEGLEGPKLGLVCRTNGGAIEAAEMVVGRYPRIPFFLDNFSHVLQEVESLEALRQNERKAIVSERVKRFETWGEALDEAEYGGDPEFTRLVKLVSDDGLGRVRKLDALRGKDESAAMVKICTGHRAKGLEWPSVRMWDDFQTIEKMELEYDKARVRGPAVAQRALEEWNLAYVAATRAMEVTRMPLALESEIKEIGVRRPAREEMAAAM